MALRLLGRGRRPQPGLLGGARSNVPGSADTPPRLYSCSSFSGRGGSGGVLSTLLPGLRRRMSTSPGQGRSKYHANAAVAEDLHRNNGSAQGGGTIIHAYDRKWKKLHGMATAYFLFQSLLLYDQVYDKALGREIWEDSLRYHISVLEEDIKMLEERY